MRDREEEMRHRGTAYMRAIQHFYKKFGRYPNKVEELENTNNVRFLRKRYTDPMNRDPATGKEKDFKFLHQQDISLNNGPVLGQGQAHPAQGRRAGGQQGAFGGKALGRAKADSAERRAALAARKADWRDAERPGGFGAQNARPQQATPEPPAMLRADQRQAVRQSSSGNTPNASAGSNASGSTHPMALQLRFTASTGRLSAAARSSALPARAKRRASACSSEKNHYNDWLFIYMPQADRGGLLIGPINPGMQTGGTWADSLPDKWRGQSAGGPKADLARADSDKAALGQSGSGPRTGRAAGNQGLQPQTPQTPHRRRSSRCERVSQAYNSQQWKSPASRAGHFPKAKRC